jgi:hypothetical protein
VLSSLFDLHVLLNACQRFFLDHGWHSTVSQKFGKRRTQREFAEAVSKQFVLIRFDGRGFPDAARPTLVALIRLDEFSAKTWLPCDK